MSGCLQSEILEVNLKWMPIGCLDSCSRGLEQQFNRIPAVNSVRIYGPAGLAQLKWNPNRPFSFRSIEMAMAMIGVSLDEIDVVVRGTVTQEQRAWILTSSGDGSRFHLLGIPQQLSNRHVEQESPFNRELSSQEISQLQEAEKQQRTVTITGPLFHPETSPPLFLVISKLTEESNTKTQSR